MDIIFKGRKEEIERFVNEVIYPVIKEKQKQTDRKYFRITDDKGDYRSKKADNIVVRRIRGYFPGDYYKVTVPAETSTENDDAAETK